MLDVRQAYLDFFCKNNHKIYDSMPLVPHDASLLFTNAGMVQFKDIFTGKIPIPTPPRATSSQLCIRAGGKHNDLENVGYTARHHTLFEMLGNFSFGDYFKKEAIAYGWEFVTKVLGFDKKLLYITVHESDDEAFDLWCQHVSPDRIKRMGDKDNFWQMGDSGPCGPCSEIYVDQGEHYFHSNEDYFGGDGDRFLEIWNLVFMQYEQKDGTKTPLPKPSIDTGMGLERVVALLENKINNFDTSLFAPLMQTIEKITGIQYYHDDVLFDNKMGFAHSELQRIQKEIASFRVIADHARSIAFLLAQGVNFDKEGRGYVLRRILRRAVRHGYLLGLRDAFLFDVISSVCDCMGAHYNFLQERKNAICQQCKSEEERFLETIELGMELFTTELSKTHDKFDGKIAFKLYDTYGFPLDLTQDMLREQNIDVDLACFEECMNEQKSRSKAHWKGSGDDVIEGDFHTIISDFGENHFIGYGAMEAQTQIIALLDSTFKRTNYLAANSMGYVFLRSTPFYPESGGAIGDKGEIWDTDRLVADVVDTKKYFGLNLSTIRTKEAIAVNSHVFVKVDLRRLEIVKHHSATHLLHLALRQILGKHVGQAGSLVEAHRLRFDFSHPKAISHDEIEQIEESVNAKILQADSQICEIMPLADAKAKGAMALFGEKYGKEVRVITFGDSIELCGGIHVDNTAQIGSFYITKESGVSSGVRRIEAVCGRSAYEYGKTAIHDIHKAKEELHAQDIFTGISKLKMQLKELKKKPSMSKDDIATLSFEQIKDTKLIVSLIETGNIKEIIDRVKNENHSVAILLIAVQDAKITLAAGVKNACLKAGEWIKEVAQFLDGNGGGRDDFATAGGKNHNKIPDALELAKKIARFNLS